MPRRTARSKQSTPRSARHGEPCSWSFRSLPLIVLLAFCSLCGRAETFQAPDPGPGIIPITGTWQFHTGDNLAWANPAFNDAGWQAIRADAPWGAQGHRGYTGYAWYRKRIDIGAGDKSLGIFIPASDGAYEVYWNGRRIGSSGELPPHAAWYLAGQNAVFPLSSGGAAAGVLALRFWAPLAGASADPDDGGLHGAPRVGRLLLLQQQLQLGGLRTLSRYLPSVIASFLIGAGALLSLIMFLRRRSDWLYLWLSLLFAGNVIVAFASFSIRTLAFQRDQGLNQLGLSCSAVGLWLTLLWIFNLNRSKWWRWVTAGVIAVYLAAQLVDAVLVWFWQSAGAGFVRTDALTTQIYAGLELFVLFLVGFGLARRKTSSLVPLGLIAGLCGVWDPVLQLSTVVSPAFGTSLQRWGLQLGEYHFFAFTLLSWLLVLTLAFTVARRQIREGRRQAHLEQEIRSAQEVQQVLIPEEIPSIPGLAVTSIYKPAAEVGGDFFQVIPVESHGEEPSTLIVVGDVSGKGLKAAMTVSLIVGTLRTLAESTRDPGEILAGLNRRLLGRTQGGFATCLVLRVDANGTATLANAGHLSPFRDGVEFEVPASLPLGLSADAEYDEVRLALHESETLMFITDGVLEARNERGEIYGFERVASLMRAQPSAEQVAEAAAGFGQEDDITVLSVSRTQSRERLPVTSLPPLPVAAG